MRRKILKMLGKEGCALAGMVCAGCREVEEYCTQEGTFAGRTLIRQGRPVIFLTYNPYFCPNAEGATEISFVSTAVSQTKQKRRHRKWETEGSPRESSRDDLLDEWKGSSGREAQCGQWRRPCPGHTVRRGLLKSKKFT